MGGVVTTLMDRANERALEPCAFIQKYANYGVNNVPYSEPSADSSAVYRMHSFPDTVFERLADIYFYQIGNTVSNLRTLCRRRGDAPAIAYRPVERMEAVLAAGTRVPPSAPGSDDGDSAGSTADSKKRAAVRYITHYGERVVMSYRELWDAIERFGVGLHAVLERNRSLLRESRGDATSAARAYGAGGTAAADGRIAGHDGVNAAPGAGAGASHCHIPRRPAYRYQQAPVLGVDAVKVAIFEDTRWEWIASIFGLWTQRLVAVTVYANLGEEALCCALMESDCEAIVCNGRSVPLLYRLMKKGRLPWSSIIYLDKLPADFTLPQDSPDGQRLSRLLAPWSSLVTAGDAALSDEDAPFAPDEAVPTSAPLPAVARPQLPASNDHLALIMYTSGTTGKPKGVMHTHGSIVAGVETLNDKLVWIEPYLPSDNQTYCAFLPLAHIMEFVCINIFLHRGFLVCFSNPRTLTDEFARPHGDFREYKPLILMAVPRIYDVLRKSVLASLPPPGTLKRRIFDQAYAARKHALQRGLDTPYYNAKVFSKIRSAFGGRLVLMLSGGGLLSEATHEFVNVCMGLVVEGYGLTETIACGSTQMIGSLEYSNVGELMKACEIKLLDTDDFKHTDTPEPRGEILLRGPFLFKGYYKQPELTKEALDDDGWFHTGDVGSIALQSQNVLRIVGRIKALAKNANGEYLPIEALEAIYSGNELSLPNSTCLLVHPLRNYVGALALTDSKLVASFLARNPSVAETVSTTVYPDILQDPAFLAAAAESFRATARDAKRRSFELVRHVRLLSDEWTPENGMLTAALKLKRKELEHKYADTIAAIFREG